MIGKPKIIGSIFCQKDIIDTLEEMEAVEKAGSNVVEIRLDTENGIGDPNSTFFNTSLETITTCMTKNEGGYFDDTLDKWAALLKKAVNCGTHYISVGLEQTKTEQGKEIIKYAKRYKSRGPKVIISDHGQVMPAKEIIIEILEREKAAGADIAKVAYTANDPKDISEIIEASLHDLGIPKIMIAMGEHGKFWRAVSLCSPWNCWGMFAYVDKPTGLGQLSIKDIIEILKILNKR